LLTQKPPKAGRLSEINKKNDMKNGKNLSNDIASERLSTARVKGLIGSDGSQEIREELL